MRMSARSGKMRCVACMIITGHHWTIPCSVIFRNKDLSILVSSKGSCARWRGTCMVDTRKLLFGLENYQKRLQQHLAQLQKEYQQLERRWHVFRDVYAGDAADQFM